MINTIAGGGKGPAATDAGRDLPTSDGYMPNPVNLDTKIAPPMIEKMKLRSAGLSTGTSAATATVPTRGTGPAASGGPSVALARATAQAIIERNTIDLDGMSEIMFNDGTLKGTKSVAPRRRTSSRDSQRSTSTRSSRASLLIIGSEKIV